MMGDLDGFWIGKPGNLFGLPGFVGSIDVSHGDRVTLESAASGRRYGWVSADRKPREWRVSIPSLTPREISDLMALQHERVPEYMWISNEAASTNILTPEASLGYSYPELQSVGSYPIEDGTRAVSARHNPAAVSGDGVVAIGDAPVIPGRACSISVQVAGRRAGGASLYYQWLNADGVAMSSHTAPGVTSGLDVLRRSTASAVPPVGCVAVRVAAIRAEYFAQTQVSWTDAPVEWGVGGLAQRAVVSGLEESVTRAKREANDPRGRLRNISFTVSEVG